MNKEKMLTKPIKKAVEEYQCPGCVCGSDTSCYENNGDINIACLKHVAGTMMTSIGRIFLGMPKGFDRLGREEKLKINIFKDIKSKNTIWEYDKFNIPAWKYKNKNGHIFIRGLLPRVNTTFIHIILNDKGFSDIKCLEITEKDLSKMD